MTGKILSFSTQPLFRTALRVVFWVIAASLLLVGMFGRGFRDSGGGFTSPSAFMIGLALSLAVLGWGIVKRGWLMWGWLSLAIAGQAAALQLIDAGRQMGFQHYAPWDGRLSSQPVVLATILIQTLLVITGIVNKRLHIWNWTRDRIKSWQIVFIFTALLLISASANVNYRLFLSELIFAWCVLLINTGNIILILLTVPKEMLPKLEERFDKVFGLPVSEGADTGVLLDRYVIIIASIVVVVSAALSLLVYQAHPHIPDEVIYLYQARFLANGDIIRAAPPVPEAFSFYLMGFSGDQWFPVTPIGWPAMLGMGVKFGMPWIINPLLAGLNILLTYFILTKLYTRRVARISILLLCLSPWYIFMAMNYMAHTFTLTCTLAATWWVMLARETRKIWWAAAAGMAIGLVALIRPVDGLIIAALLGMWAIGIGGSRLGWPALGALIGMTALVAGLVLPFNKILTGSATTFPINVYTDRVFGFNSNAYGFGPDRGMGWPTDPNPGHSLLDGIINLQVNAVTLNVELFGWTAGSLLIVLWFIVSGRYRTSDLLLLGAILLNAGAYFFYYFSGGSDIGPRYWFFMLIPMIVFTVRGIQNLSSTKTHPYPSKENSRLLFGVFVLCFIAWSTFFPWRIVDKYYRYLQMRPDLRELANSGLFDNGLVLIQGEVFPDYTSAAAYNPLSFDGNDPIFAKDGIDLREQLFKAFPNKDIWIVAGPSITGSGYRILEGPAEPEAVQSAPPTR